MVFHSKQTHLTGCFESEAELVDNIFIDVDFVSVRPLRHLIIASLVRLCVAPTQVKVLPVLPACNPWKLEIEFDSFLRSVGKHHHAPPMMVVQRHSDGCTQCTAEHQ